MTSEYFNENFSVFGQIENLWMDIKQLQRHFTYSTSGRLSWYKFHNCFMCEFMAYCTPKNAKMNLKSTTTNGFNFQLINSLMESCGGRGYAWPGFTVIIIQYLLLIDYFFSNIKNVWSYQRWFLELTTKSLRFLQQRHHIFHQRILQ